jgi:hypothetical protein
VQQVLPDADGWVPGFDTKLAGGAASALVQHAEAVDEQDLGLDCRQA